MNTMRGTFIRFAIFHKASVCTCTPSTALTTNTARSHARNAAIASPTKSA